MAWNDVLYSIYEGRIAAGLNPDRIPRHVGVILDGNRRWAAGQGGSTAQGHAAGAAKIEELLSWCNEVGVEVVTLWLLSTDNLGRPSAELAPLLDIISRTVTELASTQRWRINPVGALDLLPEPTALALKTAAESTATVTGMTVNVAVGYGGRREVVDAVRALLADASLRGESLDELAATIDADDIAGFLYTKGQPDPDLVIRTSGEQRLGGFLLWQSAHSEFYFCEAYWPDFRRVDFLRALRAYGARQRRFGA
jgi:short-chain Z-isoprenyl diphosphate synthase